MTLSILCVTNYEQPRTPDFIEAMARLAQAIGAEFVLGLDGERAQGAQFAEFADKTIALKADKLQEDVLDQAVDACTGDWLLRLDDDEKVSPALWNWIAAEGYIKARSPLYAFPRIYMYPDECHFLVNDGLWPDLQTRLGYRNWMYGYNSVHAGNSHGTGRIAPYAIEHHKLLVRDLDSRKGIAERYEQCRKGAGNDPLYARYNVPELVYRELLWKEYTNNGNFSAR